MLVVTSLEGTSHNPMLDTPGPWRRLEQIQPCYFHRSKLSSHQNYLIWFFVPFSLFWQRYLWRKYGSQLSYWGVGLATLGFKLQSRGDFVWVHWRVGLVWVDIWSVMKIYLAITGHNCMGMIIIHWIFSRANTLYLRVLYGKNLFDKFSHIKSTFQHNNIK